MKNLPQGWSLATAIHINTRSAPPRVGFSTASAMLVMAAAMPAAPVLGQGAGALEEIVITAERRVGNLQGTPIAVSALNSEALENRQIYAVQGLENYVPGMRLTTSISNPTTVTVSIRGSTQQDAALVTAESPIGIYVDDIYIARLQGANLPLDDVERVEVLRGPQGTLYGRNTLSGALKIITRTPGDERWGTASVGYGNYGSYRVSGSYGAPVSDTAAFSIAGAAAGSDGFYKNVATGDDFGEQSSHMVRGKVRLTPSERFEVVAGLSYYKASLEATANVPNLAPGDAQISTSQITPRFGDDYRVSIPTLDPAPGLLTPTPDGEVTQIIGSLNIAYDLGEATFRSITGYVDTEDFFSTDLAGFNNGLPLGGDADSSVFSQELHLLGNSLNDRLDWIVGAYYFEEDADQTIALVTSQLSSVRTKSYALFGQGTYAISDPLSVTAGLRYTDESKRFVGAIRDLGFPFPPADFTSKDSFDAWTPKLSLNYELPHAESGVFDSALLYVSAARGFKSGGYNGTPVVSPGILATVYDPEKNWTYELGLKSELMGGRLRANAALFYSDIQDLVSTANREFMGVTVFPIDNIGDAEIQGLELELTAKPLDSLTLYLNATFQDGEYGEIEPDSAAALAQQNFGDARIQQLPDYAFSAGFDYAIELGAGMTFRVGGDWYRTDDYAFSVPNDLIIDGYDRYNGYVALQVNDRWDLRVEATNLSDETQYQGGVKGLSYLLLPPRQVIATVRFNL